MGHEHFSVSKRLLFSTGIYSRTKICTVCNPCMYDTDHKPEEVHASRLHCSVTEWYTFSDFFNFSFFLSEVVKVSS